jgi:HK97 family phage prohead protease
MLELKTLDFGLETKDLSDEGEFEGLASTFGNVDQVGDVVLPGAFMPSIVQNRKDGRVAPMLWMHNPEEPVGVWTEMVETVKGLLVKGRLLIETDPLAKRIYGLMKAKGAVALSIGFRIPAGGAEADEKRPGVMKLSKIDLREISLVTMPANLQARVLGVKSFTNDNRPTQKQLEAFLAAHFCSNPLAAAIAARALPVLRGDPEEKADPQADFLRILRETLG